MSHKATRLVFALVLWVALGGSADTDRNTRIVRLVYEAKRLGATYETMVQVCRGHWVCSQVVADAYNKPTTTPYRRLK